jgi:2-polyprenyl-3-methyl-5-hydroxy-6-metoxy-1,4-benzoquinol methylase
MEDRLYKKFYEIQKSHWWFRGKKDIVLDVIDQLKLSSGMNILDVGCGSGLMLSDLAKIGHVSGMDASLDGLAFCKEIFNGPLELCHLPENIPYKDRSFDLITMLDVLEHIEDDLGALSSIKNLLTKNGILILTVPANMNLWSHFDVLNHHKRRYESKQLSKLAVKSGFEVIKISYYNSFLYPLILLKRKLNNLNKNISDDLNIPSTILNYILFNIFKFEKYILRRMTFSFGVSLILIARAS